jgi:hypothetical protein
MSLFISKYKVWKLILEEHQINDRGITLLYFSQQWCDITKIYGTKINVYCYNNKCSISFELICFGV